MMATRKHKDKKKKSGAVTIPLEWVYPDDQVGRFANHLFVQHDQHEFHLSFFELKPPLLVGTEDERKHQAEKIGKLEATCLARVIVSEGRMPDFVKVLQETLDKVRRASETIPKHPKHTTNGRNK